MQKKAWVEPYRKAAGSDVLAIEYTGDLAKVKAMVEARQVTWNAVEVQSSDVGRGCEDGLFEKLDWNNVGKKSDFILEAVTACGVGSFIWSTVLAYNAERLRGEPSGWKDFWDVKRFPGKRGMRKEARSNLEFALLADGVEPKEVYAVLAIKAGVERRFKKMDEIRPYMQWWEAGAQPPQFLAAGDVVMSTAYNGRIDVAQREGNKSLRRMAACRTRLRTASRPFSRTSSSGPTTAKSSSSASRRGLRDNSWTACLIAYPSRRC